MAVVLIGGARVQRVAASFLRLPARLARRFAHRFVGGVRARLVVLSLFVLMVVSFGFTLANNAIQTAWIDQDFRLQAINFGREISATISDQREFEGDELLLGDIRRIMVVRPNVLQMDILRFSPSGKHIVISSDKTSRLPFNREEGELVRKGKVVSKLSANKDGRFWNTMVPIRIDGAVAGALSARFSLVAADDLVRRIRWLGFGFSALSVAVMGVLMWLAVTYTVNRPIGAFLAAIDRINDGAIGVRVTPGGAEEFDALARPFNDMLDRMESFSDEVTHRIAAATRELAGRFDEVQRLNEVLYRTRSELSHAERLAVAGQMVAQIAHEVGTPLHSIAGHLELLRGELAKDSGAGSGIERIDVVDGQLARVNAIIRQLLDLVHRDHAPSSAVDIAALVGGSMDIMRPGFSAKRIELLSEIEAGLPPALGREGPLMQVMLNLLSNAVDATPNGGAVTISARRDGQSDVVVAVSDTGPGIPAARRREVFDPFVTTKPAGEGTGLGLFIAAQIVREHGGRIEVDDGDGGGCTIRIVVPIAEVGA